MTGLVRPHGESDLKPLALQGEALARELARSRTLRSLRVSSREKGDIIMLGIGGFTPLAGFMTCADWRGVCDRFITIPTRGGASLSMSHAAAIVLAEAARQRFATELSYPDADPND